MALLCLTVFLHGCATHTDTRPTTPAAATKNVQVVARKGMVASAHALASQAGLRILKLGGNAIDAAVATAFAIGVVEPSNSGLGGEGNMVIYHAESRKAVAIDYRSVAPAKATFKSRIPSTGHTAVAVPGTVAGLTKALQEFGTMKLADVMAPAIQYAEEGFIISPMLAADITDGFDEIQKNETLAAILCPGGLPLESGARLKNPDLARSLRKIAAGGPDVFYRGEIAEAISADMAAHGGFITQEDLAAYGSMVREPVRGSYRGFDLVGVPPPVAGTAVIEILQILEHFDLAKNGPLTPVNVHLMAEAMKRGFADHSAYVADPDFVKVPLGRLLSREYAAQRAKEIRPDQLTPKVSAGDAGAPESPSTTTLCVVDQKGNTVALTQTLSDHMGAKVAVPGTGIFLNNEMKNFSSKGINAMAPGKRMRGTQSPMIVLQDGKPYASLGTPGAGRIISTMTILLSNLIDHKMSIQEAIESPRFFVRDTEKDMSVEARVPKETVEALTRLGYTFQTLNEFDLFFGGAQGIVIERKGGKLLGGADPRRDGAVAGY